MVLRPCGPPSTAAAASAALALEMPGDPSRGPAQNTVPAPGITAGSAQQQQRTGRASPQLPPQPQRLPASTWNALSALAGGSASTTRNGGVVRGGATPASPPATSPTGPASPAGKGGGKKGPPGGPNPAGDFARQSQQGQQPQHAQQPPQRAEQQQQQQPASKEDISRPGSPGYNFFQGTPPTAPPRPQQAQQQQAQQRQPPRPQPADQAQQPSPAQQPRVTVGDYLADSLTAQSLDLPPAVREHPLPTAACNSPELDMYIRVCAQAYATQDGPCVALH